jgi:uncharacterized membrane protein
MISALSVLMGLAVIISIQPAFAQTIDVNVTTPCFLNYTAGIQIWEDCGMGEDWLQASIIGFEWATGGWFSMILAAVLILFTYIKYHKAIYPIIVGITFVPIAYFLFPAQWWLFITVMILTAIGAGLYYVYTRRTTEFS